MWLTGLQAASTSSGIYSPVSQWPWVYWMYFYTFAGLAERPTFLQLIRFSIGDKNVNIIEMIGTNYFNFGISLLQDDTGAKMDAIVEHCREDATKINRQVLRKWLEGGGKQPVSWATLATELELCGLTELAKDIRTVKSK